MSEIMLDTQNNIMDKDKARMMTQWPVKLDLFQNKLVLACIISLSNQSMWERLGAQLLLCIKLTDDELYIFKFYEK